jgi:hypothetical protein
MDVLGSNGTRVKPFMERMLERVDGAGDYRVRVTMVRHGVILRGMYVIVSRGAQEAGAR